MGADANGLIIYRGKLIAQWGDVDSVDMTLGPTAHCERPVAIINTMMCELIY